MTDNEPLGVLLVTLNGYYLLSLMYNIVIIRFGFGDIQNNQGLERGYQPQPWVLADNPHLTLDYSGYHENLLQ